MRPAGKGGSALGLLLAVLCGLPIAGPAGASEPGRVSLTYDLYNGGFHLLTVNLDLAVLGQRYEVVTRLETAGVLSWLFSWTQVSETRGVILADALAPVMHRSEGRTRGRHRSVEIAYVDGRIGAVRVEPPPHEDGDRDEVPLPLRHGAIDPVSAILGTMHRLGAGEPCAGRLSVFDGRRRYDLVLSDRGHRALPESSYADFAGETLRCDFTYEPIAGHVRRSEASDAHGRRAVQSGRVYVARLDGSLVAPVRVEIDGGWGVTVAHLREIRRPPPGAPGAVRPER